jgi:hypothetical protein
LPDGLVSNQKSQIWFILEGLGMENVFVFYEHLKYFMVIWYNLLQFGIVCGHFDIFPILVSLDQEKSGNPGRHAERQRKSYRNKETKKNLMFFGSRVTR